MSKKVIAAVAATVVLFAGAANAASSSAGMEKCMPTGKLMVKPNMSDCGADNTNCVMLPKGICAKVQDAGKTGDMKGLPQDVQDKLEMAPVSAANAAVATPTAGAATGSNAADTAAGSATTGSNAGTHAGH